MPDSTDYDTFFGLLDHPERWTPSDRRTVEFALVQQRHLLNACHPKDHRWRSSLASIVEQIEAALGAASA
jgi:hypothetical protein